MIEKYLKAFLSQKGSVSVLGLGNFSLEYIKPKVDPDNKSISPPSKIVQFKWNPKERDTGFISFMAKNQKLKLAEAQVLLKREVSDLLKKLDKSKKVEWTDLGEFSGDPNNVVFKSFGKNLHRSAAGMEGVKPVPVPAQPKREEAPVPAMTSKEDVKKPNEKSTSSIVPATPIVKKEEMPASNTPKAPSMESKEGKSPIEQPKKKKASMAWLWIVLIVILAGSAITLYIFNRKPIPPPVVVVPEPEPEPEPVIEETPPPPPPKILTISERGGRFYIILGGFKNKNNAMKLRDQIEAKGASEAKVIMPYAPKKLYRVSIEDYDNQQAAIKAMVGLRATYGNYIWVLTY